MTTIHCQSASSALLYTDATFTSQGKVATSVVVGTNAMPMVEPQPFSLHARCRAARRNVADAIDYVLAYGRAIHRTGVTFYFLGRRDIPRMDRRASWVARLEGTVVLVAETGEIITVYRNRNALRLIQRKAKYRLALPPDDEHIEDFAQAG